MNEPKDGDVFDLSKDRLLYLDACIQEVRPSLPVYTFSSIAVYSDLVLLTHGDGCNQDADTRVLDYGYYCRVYSLCSVS